MLREPEITTEEGVEIHRVPSSDHSIIAFTHLPGKGDPVVLLHGTNVDRRVFYHAEKERLGNWLQARGWDVWIMEWREHGARTRVRGMHRNMDTLEDCIPDAVTAIEYLAKVRKGKKQLWLAHSWGGILLTAALARQPELQQQIIALVLSGTQTQMMGRVWWKRRIADAVALACYLVGRFPAKKLNWGPEDELLGVMLQWRRWEGRSRMVGDADGFDYFAALGEIKLPLLAYAGKADKIDSPPEECAYYFERMGGEPKTFHTIGVEEGYGYDATHASMIVGEEPKTRVWVEIDEFFGQYGTRGK